MYGAFVSLLNMSAAAAILIGAVIVLRLLLRRVPRKYICILWALAALRLVLPVSITSELSVYNYSSRFNPDSSRIEYIRYTGHPEKPEAEFIIPAGAISSPDGPTVTLRTADFYLPTVMTLWAAGAGAMVVYAGLSYWRIHRRTRACLRMTGNVYLCDSIPTPFLLGLFRPRIYLPSILTGEQMRSVIAHERAHIRRLDHVWKPLGFLLLSVHWFNPMVWVGYGLFCRDIELACDERVIRDMTAAQKQDYSRTLLSCSMPRGFISACPLAFGEIGVKQRVRGILNYRKPTFWAVLVSVLVCAAVAVCFLTNPSQPEVTGPTVVKQDDLTFILPARVDYRDGMLISGGKTVGGVRTFPAPNGEKPKDLDWIQTLDLSEWQAEDIGWFADGGNGRYTIEFFSDVPPEVERTVMTVHNFFYSGGMIYDLWFDQLAADASLWQTVPNTVRTPDMPEPTLPASGGEEAARETLNAVFAALSSRGTYLVSDRMPETATAGGHEIQDIYLVDGNCFSTTISMDASGRSRTDAALMVDGKSWSNAGSEYDEEITWVPARTEPRMPWVTSCDLDDLEYIDTLVTEEGTVYMYHCSKAYPGEAAPGYWVNFDFTPEGQLSAIQLRVHLYEDNAFTVTETPLSTDTEMLRARIAAEYEKANG